MCLHVIDKDETKRYKKYTKTIVAYKIVKKVRINGKTIYVPPFGASSSVFHFRKGVNTDSSPNTKRLKCDYVSDTYKIGFHSFIYDEDFCQEDISAFIADYFSVPGHEKLRIIKVYIDPKDVTKVGVQNSCRVVVSRALTIKSFKNCFNLEENL